MGRKLNDDEFQIYIAIFLHFQCQNHCLNAATYRFYAKIFYIYIHKLQILHIPKCSNYLAGQMKIAVIIQMLLSEI